MIDRRNRAGWGPSRPRLWLWVVLASVVAVIALSAGGIAYATHDYSRDYEGRILPGARIAGVDVGGLDTEAALRALERVVEPKLTRTVTVGHGYQSWQVTPEELGARSNAARVVQAALQESEKASFMERARMALLGDEIDFERELSFVYPRRGPRSFVERLASRLNREVVDAGIDYSTGWVEITPARPGRKVDVKKSTNALTRALRQGTPSVDLTVDAIQPEVTEEDFDKVLLLRIGENRLYLYENGARSRSWTVATGQPEYPTPTGIYEITEKRYMPTWVNPDPTGWGASMPRVIPPGPNNPLGTRALNWSASGIRFHGTTATYSLGHNASHGCVRLSMPDVEVLYELVDVGTPIVSVEAGEYKPLYRSGPDPLLVRGGSRRG